MAPATIADIRSALHLALAGIPAHDHCALLGFPSHGNVGDHMIWLGSARYLTKEKGYRIGYVSDVAQFSAREMETTVGDGPLFFTGGGNLGDLWPKSQVLRETVISRYRDRPIAILPQSMYFSSSDALKRAEDVFNGHPDLTIYVREETSHKLAMKHFSDCRIVLAPDMSFAMDDLQREVNTGERCSSWLYLCRNDCEHNQSSALPRQIADTATQLDWPSIYRKCECPRPPRRESASRLRTLPESGVLTAVWNRLPKLLQPSNRRTQLPRKTVETRMRELSRDILQSGIDQLEHFDLIATDRLHGHILALLLGTPNALLPNTYHKNQSFYETWTCNLPQSSFGAQALVESLRELPGNAGCSSNLANTRQ